MGFVLTPAPVARFPSRRSVDAFIADGIAGIAEFLGACHRKNDDGVGIAGEVQADEARPPNLPSAFGHGHDEIADMVVIFDLFVPPFRGKSAELQLLQAFLDPRTSSGPSCFLYFKSDPLIDKCVRKGDRRQRFIDFVDAALAKTLFEVPRVRLPDP
jgi:hypothetical protein